MSQAHIPQPGPGAPDEVFDSVSSQATQNVVSALGNPAGPPQEIPAHTGQMNGFDPKIHMQWVPIDTIIWSVNQPSGVLLWKRPIHPSFSNPLLSYLAGIYNTWGGNLDYRFKVAGTGFHAGAIAIVRIPPNRKPEEFQTPQAWGAFEYMVIDPKTLETESVGVSDQRPIAFHYFPFKQDDSYTFGGWIAMYVLIPLNTSATGSQQIAIQAFNKPGDNFQYSQLIMPASNEIANPFPPQYQSYFEDFDLNNITTAPCITSYIAIEPDSLKETFFVANCYKVDGSPMSQYASATPSPVDTTIDAALQGRVIKLDKLEIQLLQDYISILVPNKSAMGLCGLQTGDKAIAEGFENVEVVVAYGNSVVWDVNQTASKVKEDSQVGILFTEGKLDDKYKDNVYAASIEGESIIHFRDATKKIPSVQNRRLTQLFKSGKLKRMFFSNTCALFTMVSVDEGLPLGQVKLYYEGFFTARSTKSQVLLDADKIKFEFSGYIARTDPIPGNVEYAKNMMTFRAFSQSQLSRRQFM